MGAVDVLQVGVGQIEEARDRIRRAAWRTPTLPASRDETGLSLKLECLQRTGSFKVRGAWNRMSRTTSEERQRGFVTASAGNHGQAVAWCARELQSPCTVCVPQDAVDRKVRAIEAMGASILRMPHEEIMELLVHGRLEAGGMTFIHPFADPHVVAGQGTVGLEILEDVPDVASVIVPVGGGGLVSGIAIALHARRPDVKVYGVQAEGSAPLPMSLASGRAERVTGPPRTIADGIAATMTFEAMVPLLVEHLAGAFVVSDDEMKASMRHLLLESRVVAEPAGAASLAAARRHAPELAEPIVCVVSGGNADPRLLAALLQTETQG